MSGTANMQPLKMMGKRFFSLLIPVEKKGINKLLTISAMVTVMVYAATAFIFPLLESTMHALGILLLLSAASYEDIREKRISVSVLIGLLLIGILHTVFFTADYIVWLAAAAFSVLLLCIFLIRRKAVGLGDILLLGLAASSLSPGNILSFLFLSFMLSSVTGIAQMAFTRSREAIVPMAPCVTLAWLAVFLIWN